MEPRVPVTIEARLSYRNKGDAPDDWKLYANSTESRTMDCSPPTVSHKLYIQGTIIWETCYIFRKMDTYTTVRCYHYLNLVLYTMISTFWIFGSLSFMKITVD